MSSYRLNRGKANELANVVKEIQSLHSQISKLITSLNNAVLTASSNIEEYAFIEVYNVRCGFKQEEPEKAECLNTLMNEYYDVSKALSSTYSDINKTAIRFDEVSVKLSRVSKKLLELNNSDAYDWIHIKIEEAED